MTTVGSRPAPTAPGGHAPLRGPRGPAFALTDQVLSSASNFLLGVIVARAGGAEALGTFGVAFLVWLAILGTSRALISEPMTVVGEPDALWPRSRWFVAEFATAFPADQGYLLLLPLLLSTAEFGMYRAGASLVGPVVVLFVAGGNVGLPSAVRSLRDGGAAGLARFAPRLTAAVSGATIVYCGLVALLAEPLLHLAYGADFADAATVTRIVALQYVIYSLSFGWGVATKAADRMRRLWGVRLVSVVVSVAAVVLFTRDLGTTGAAFAGVATACVYSAGVVLAFRSVRRGGAHRRRR